MISSRKGVRSVATTLPRRVGPNHELQAASHLEVLQVRHHFIAARPVDAESLGERELGPKVEVEAWLKRVQKILNKMSQQSSNHDRR